MSIDGAQLKVRQMGEPPLTHFQGADVSVIEREFLPMEFMADKGHIEFGVVGDKDAVADELFKFRYYFFRFRFSCQHFSGNAVHLPGLLADRPVRVNQGAVFFHDGPAFYR